MTTFGTREFFFWNSRVLELEFLELESFWNSMTFGTREFLELESFWNFFWNSRVLELESFGTREFLELESLECDFWNSITREFLELESLNKQPGSSSRDDNCGQRFAFRR